MSTVVFFGIPAHGHFNPTLGIVRELVRRGYRVVYYCTEEFSTKLVDAGAEFRSYRKDFSADIQRQGMNLLELAYTLLNTTLFILDNLLGRYGLSDQTV